MSAFSERLQHAWNAFMNKDPTSYMKDYGVSYSTRPDRIRLTRGNERTIITSVFNRIALDCSAIDIKHVRLDERDRYISTIDSGLNNCLTLEANKDQTGRSLIQDIVMTMLDEGVVALVPVDTSINPAVSTSYEIETVRTAKIVQWYPDHVKVRIYNDRTGKFEEIVVLKKTVSIIQSPLYSVINEPNSTLQRLTRKLSLLDYIDEQSGAGKLDLIIQLPYIVRNETRREQANKRRKEIEEQLTGSKFGIAYTDGTEHITQLNRPVDNQLLTQIESLTRILYSQLGITEEIMNGTADDKAMTNYYNRTIEPIMSAIVDEMKRKFLTKTARSQKQSIKFFRDPFKLVPVTEMAELADKLTRNEVLTSNEVRQIIGLQPANDPNADALRNKNISQASDAQVLDVDGNPIGGMPQQGMTEEEYQLKMSELDDIDDDLDTLDKLVGR